MKNSIHRLIIKCLMYHISWAVHLWENQMHHHKRNIKQKDLMNNMKRFSTHSSSTVNGNQLLFFDLSAWRRLSLLFTGPSTKVVAGNSLQWPTPKTNTQITYMYSNSEWQSIWIFYQTVAAYNDSPWKTPSWTP